MVTSADILVPGLREAASDIVFKAGSSHELGEVLSEIAVQSYRALMRSEVMRWNAVGPADEAFRRLAEAHYAELHSGIDQIADRLETLGLPAPTSKAALGLDKALSLSGRITTESLADDLVDDHRALARLIRDAASIADEGGDLDTRDMLVTRLAFHEESIWALKAVTAG